MKSIISTKNLNPEIGDVFSCYVPEYKKYGAYQILDVMKNSITYVTLDYFKIEPPTINDLANMKPFHREMYKNHHNIAMTIISNNRVPKDYIYIGNCNPIVNKPCNSFTDDWNDGFDYICMEKWNNIAEEARIKYKKYINSGEQIKIGDSWYKINYSCMRNDLYQYMLQGKDISQLPCIISADIDGFSFQLIEYMKNNHMLRELTLNHPNARILDFRATHLQILHIDVTGVQKIYLSQNLTRLELSGEINNMLEIDDSICKFKIELNILEVSPEFYNLSLKNINTLRIYNIKELDMAKIAQHFPLLENLILFGNPGIILNFSTIGNLCFLRKLSIDNLFGFDENDVKNLEKCNKLNRLFMDSIPCNAGIYLKKKYKNNLDSVEITKLRNEKWLSENIHNPLRHWDGCEFIPIAAYKKTMTLYKKVIKELQETDTKESIINVIIAFIQSLNDLNEKYDMFIETEEREDIYIVIEQLYLDYLQGKDLITLNEVDSIIDRERINW